MTLKSWIDLYINPPTLVSSSQAHTDHKVHFQTVVPESHAGLLEPVIVRHGDILRSGRAPLLRSHGCGSYRDAVPGRRRQRVERAGRDDRTVQHVGRPDALPDRRPAPVRVPEGDGLGPRRRSGGVQRLQHDDVPDQARRRHHGLHARPLRPLLLHQRQPGQLHGQPEAPRRRARRRPHPAGPLADSLHHAADVCGAAAEPSFHVAAVSSFHGAGAEPLVASVHAAAVRCADAKPDVASLCRSYAHPGIRTISDRFSSGRCSRGNSRIIAGNSRFAAFVFPWHSWRRAAATVRLHQPTRCRRGKLDYARQRSCSPDGRPNQHAGSRLWVRHAGYVSALSFV